MESSNWGRWEKHKVSVGNLMLGTSFPRFKGRLNRESRHKDRGQGNSEEMGCNRVKKTILDLTLIMQGLQGLFFMWCWLYSTGGGPDRSRWSWTPKYVLCLFNLLLFSSPLPPQVSYVSGLFSLPSLYGKCHPHPWHQLLFYMTSIFAILTLGSFLNFCLLSPSAC